MGAMVYPVSPSPKKWPDPTKEAPSPLMGEGGGEGVQRSADKLNGHFPLSLALPHEGGGNQFVAMPSFRRTQESSAFIKLDRDFRRDDLVMETTP
jgi:hypothetical protein